MKLRFFLCVITAMTLALTAAAQQEPKNLLRGRTEIVKTGEDAAGNNVWGLKNPPPARKSTPTPAPPMINSFNSDSDEINAGTAATLSFSVSGARTATINGQDVTGDAQLVVTPTTTTAYRLVATNTGGRVTEDLVIRVKPAPAPSSTDWGKLLNDYLWLILLILLLIAIAYGISEWLRERRWREDRDARADMEWNRLQPTQPAPPNPPQAPVVVNLTVNVNGGAQPTVTTEAATPQPVVSAPETVTTATDSMDGAEAAAGQSANEAGTTTASATELRAEESPATASADGTK